MLSSRPITATGGLAGPFYVLRKYIIGSVFVPPSVFFRCVFLEEDLFLTHPHEKLANAIRYIL